jgi:hypothetical protein
MLDGSSRSVGKVQLKSDFAEYQSHGIKRAKTPNVAPASFAPRIYASEHGSGIGLYRFRFFVLFSRDFALFLCRF